MSMIARRFRTTPPLFPAQEQTIPPQTTPTPQEYLTLFERYIDFLNLDVEVYLASMTHTSGGDGGGGGGDDDDDDEDGGLGVATVNLAALKTVLTKHQVPEGIMLRLKRGGARCQRIHNPAKLKWGLHCVAENC